MTGSLRVKKALMYKANAQPDLIVPFPRVIQGGWEKTYVVWNNEKDYKYLKKRAWTNWIVVTIIIFVVLMKTRINSAFVPRVKVLIFADLMNYHIIIVEYIQAQCFDNLIIRNCVRVFSTMTIRFDENKNKLGICTKGESTYICRFDELPYYHRRIHSSTVFW